MYVFNVFIVIILVWLSKLKFDSLTGGKLLMLNSQPPRSLYKNDLRTFSYFVPMLIHVMVTKRKFPETGKAPFPTITLVFSSSFVGTDMSAETSCLMKKCDPHLYDEQFFELS